MVEPLRIMALHALGYCERLFYLEEVENLRVADERVYAGRRLHVEIEREEDEGGWLTLTLESERWAGAVDSVGAATLPYVLRTMRRGAPVASSGNASGPRLETTVFPFILRGVALFGMDSVLVPIDRRHDGAGRAIINAEQHGILLGTDEEIMGCNPATVARGGGARCTDPARHGCPGDRCRRRWLGRADR